MNDIEVLEKLKENFIFNNLSMTREEQKKTAYVIENLLKERQSDKERIKELEENKECTFLEDGTEECLWMCSNCKDEWMFYDGTPEDNRLRYCPFCGAKVIRYKSYIEQERELAEEVLEELLEEK